MALTSVPAMSPPSPSGIVPRAAGCSILWNVPSRSRRYPKLRRPSSDHPTIGPIGLGPIGVLPEHQGYHVGHALMHAVLGAADALDYPLVVLLGHIDYYPRFGFVAATTLRISSPDPTWGEHFQARPLAAYQPELHGTFRYAAPFQAL